jgi:signal transduction histidine kinase
MLSPIDELLEANRPKDAMALLLHELRTPLASIQNALAVLKIRSKDDSLHQRMQDLIERQARQMALLIASICQPSSTGLLGIQPLMERIDLATVLRCAAETVIPELTARRNHLSIGFPDSSVWVFGNASQLERAFVNLLSNASKYSELGGRISLTLRVSDGHVAVDVRDFGIGISADALHSIFDLFVRADTNAVQQRSGMGIGLALVRSIICAHRGTVSAASDGCGQGSTFTVELKRAI